MTAIATTFARKRCKSCRAEFQPRAALQACCSMECAIAYSKSRPEKIREIEKKHESESKRESKARNKTIAQYLKEAQREFNRWVIQRDWNEGCISCDAGPNYEGQYAAGHYRTTAAASHHRFNPDNVWKQCGRCNHFLSGNIIEYRKRLTAKIGIERVEALENSNETVHWTREGLAALRQTYLAAWRELKNKRGQS